MTEIEKTIEDIQKQFKGIGIDYTNGKDMTAVCVLGDKAEIVIEALREYAERQDPKPLTKSQVGDRIHQHKPIYIKSLNPEYNSVWKIPDGMDKDKAKNPRLYFCDDSWIPLSAWGKDYEIYDFEPRKDE